MQPSIQFTILSIVISLVHSQENSIHRCPCRLPSDQTGDDVAASMNLKSSNCNALCKPWDKYFPRPTTRLACESSCSHFWKYLAEDYEHRSRNDLEWAHPPCTAAFISRRIPGGLPQASLPKNAAMAGCREVNYVFSKCIKRYMEKKGLKNGGGKKSLRGLQDDDGGGGEHLSKLEQLKNFKKAAAGDANDPLL